MAPTVERDGIQGVYWDVIGINLHLAYIGMSCLTMCCSHFICNNLSYVNMVIIEAR